MSIVVGLFPDCLLGVGGVWIAPRVATDAQLWLCGAMVAGWSLLSSFLTWSTRLLISLASF